jgi:hypothetical protein
MEGSVCVTGGPRDSRRLPAATALGPAPFESPLAPDVIW